MTTTINGSYPAVNSDSDATINGLTVGKGGGSGSANTAVGASVLTALTLNSGVTAVGNLAGNVYNTNSDTGASTFIGYTAGRYVTTGIDNTFIGAAGAATTTGSANTAVGSSALKSNTTASNNTAVGYQAGYSNTTGTTNTFLGTQAGYVNTTGTANFCAGYVAGYYSTGNNNTYVGAYAGPVTSTSSGSNNTSLGNSALQAVTTASYNIAVGYQAGYSTTTGSNNLFAGSAAGANTTTGSNNTFVGVGVSYGAGQLVTTGSKNSILGGYSGNQGGLDIRTASNYIVLSDGDGNPRGYFDNNGKFNVTNSSAGTDLFLATASSSSFTQVTYRSDSATAAGTGWSHFYGTSSSNAVSNVSIRGNGNLQNANNSYAGYSDIKLKENITDATPKLADLMQVKIRNYTFKVGENHKQLGVIAQEVEQIFPSIVEETPDLDKDGHPNGEYTKSVKYSIFVPMLIKAIQELKAEVDSLKQQLGK